MLASNAKIHERVPKEYCLHTTNASATNTFLFTEKDLPGYVNKTKFFSKDQDKSALPFSQAPPRAQLLDRSKAGKVDKPKRYEGNFRRAIPSKAVRSMNTVELIFS
jgi:transcription initiation factor TFIIF subunit beta